MSQQEESESILDTIGDVDALELATEFGEMEIDQFLDEGVLKDIPFLGTVVKLYQMGVGIGGYLFAKKLLRFLTQLKDVSDAEREAFRKRLDEDPKYSKKVSDHLLLLLDRLDDMQKPPLLARAFRAYIRQQIDFETFQRLATAIDRSFFVDLSALKGGDESAVFVPPRALSLSACGLLEVSQMPGARGPGATNHYTITELGRRFIDIVLAD